MKAPKRILTLSHKDYSKLLSTLIDYRNIQLSKHNHTEIVDEILLKLTKNK